MTSLWITLAISLGIQIAFFGFAAALRTDKVTDLSYSLTFIVIVVYLMVRSGSREPAAGAIALMVVLWGVRLAAYLMVRIVRMGRDRRIDGIRENFWKFLRFWTFQGVAVWTIMLPVTLWFEAPMRWNPIMTLATGVWFAGWIIESVADLQKFRARSRPGSKWTETGLWRYSRHPNYFGEMLCWWGVFLFAAPGLGGWEWAAVIGPVTLTWLLAGVTGIPPLEASAERKWGRDPAYRAYKDRTPVLIPKPRI